MLLPYSPGATRSAQPGSPPTGHSSVVGTGRARRRCVPWPPPSDRHDPSPIGRPGAPTPPAQAARTEQRTLPHPPHPPHPPPDRSRTPRLHPTVLILDGFCEASSTALWPVGTPRTVRPRTPCAPPMRSSRPSPQSDTGRHQGHQGARPTGRRGGHGLQAHRGSPGPLARGQRTQPGHPRTRGSPLRTRSPRRTRAGDRSLTRATHRHREKGSNGPRHPQRAHWSADRGDQVRHGRTPAAGRHRRAARRRQNHALARRAATSSARPSTTSPFPVNSATGEASTRPKAATGTPTTTPRCAGSCSIRLSSGRRPKVPTRGLRQMPTPHCHCRSRLSPQTPYCSSTASSSYAQNCSIDGTCASSCPSRSSRPVERARNRATVLAGSTADAAEVERS